jgi:hypothetical protein
VTDPQQDLRATQESIGQDARRVQQLEERKAALPVDDPEVDRLSEQIDSLIDHMATKAEAEKEIAAEIKPGEARPEG